MTRLTGNFVTGSVVIVASSLLTVPCLGQSGGDRSERVGDSTGTEVLATEFDPKTPPRWDLSLQTPGVTLTAVEDPAAPRPPDLPLPLRGLPLYCFKVSGSPVGTTYQLWHKKLGKAPELPSQSLDSERFVVNETGQLGMRVADKESNVSFILGWGFVLGEPIQYALVSRDGRITAFEEVIPYPLEATSAAGYRLSLKLATPRDYIVHAEGFEENQEVSFFATAGTFFDIDQHTFDARSGMGVYTGRPDDSTPMAEPGVPTHIIVGWEAPTDLDGGADTIRAIGKSGEVAVSFDWGARNQPVRSKAEDQLLAGAAEWRNKQYDNALRDFSSAIAIDSRYLHAYVLRATIRFDIKMDYEGFLEDATKAIQLDPTHDISYWFRGMLRAMCPDASFRDGPMAVADLTKACELTGWQNARYIADLGSAYAEIGDFEQAIHWQLKAIELAKDDKRIVESGEKRLALYRQKKPFHLPQKSGR